MKATHLPMKLLDSGGSLAKTLICVLVLLPQASGQLVLQEAYMGVTVEEVQPEVYS